MVVFCLFRRQQLLEFLNSAQGIEVGVLLKERVTIEPVLDRLPEPIDRALLISHQRVSRGDVICGMMKVSEALPLFDCLQDLLSRFVRFTGPGVQHGLNAA